MEHYVEAPIAETWAIPTDHTAIHSGRETSPSQSSRHNLMPSTAVIPAQGCRPTHHIYYSYRCDHVLPRMALVPEPATWAALERSISTLLITHHTYTLSVLFVLNSLSKGVIRHETKETYQVEKPASEEST